MVEVGGVPSKRDVESSEFRSDDAETEEKPREDPHSLLNFLKY